MTQATSNRTMQIRTFEFAQSVSGYLDGKLNDWPASIQDPCYAALERKAKEVQLPLCIVFSRCEVDPDVPEGKPGRFYVHVVASEIVIADERTLRPGTVTRDPNEDMERLWRDLSTRG